MTQALRRAIGQTDDIEHLTKMFGGPRTDVNGQQWDRELDQIQRHDRLKKSLMSPPGQLGLPSLLEARRLEFGITDGAFTLQPMYQRVLLFQIPIHVEEPSLISRTERQKKNDLRTAARGIVVSAGLQALDILRSNGCDIGHIVRYTHVNPWRHEIDYCEGKSFELMIVNAGDVNVSEDLAETLRGGVVKIRRTDEGEHRLVDEDGLIWDPVLPGDPQDDW